MTDAEKTFTQEDLDRIMGERVARASREAKAAAEQALKDKLGDASLDDLIASHAAAKDAENAQKSETQRALEAAVEAKAEAERIKAEAAAERHTTRVHTALIRAGIAEDAVDTIRLDVAPDADADAVKAAVDALKVKVPALFTPVVAPKANPGDPALKRESVEFGAEGLKEFELRFPKANAS